MKAYSFSASRFAGFETFGFCLVFRKSWPRRSTFLSVYEDKMDVRAIVGSDFAILVVGILKPFKEMRRLWNGLHRATPPTSRESVSGRFQASRFE
ncbi:protein of unknown function [Methylocella tundrae]|uniref:Uncharacterized protein n=1 Tax=Methylocella tundrae TaxID=227605 RepID=A0A4U8YYC7_METTU|nr:protein of unknown function [Methylocella tundrae]